MSTLRNPWILTTTIVLLTSLATVPAAAQQPSAPDSTLYTTFTINSSFSTVNWITCGSTQESDGCYGAGGLGPFNKVGALMEGNSTFKGDVVTRAIYVVDSGNATDVQLYVYKKTDTVTAGGDTVSVTLAKTITLPLTGGSNALTSMGGNDLFLFIGTSLSPQAVRVQKSNLAITQLGGFSPPLDVTSITADNYGYVTVTQGDFNSGESAFSLYGPNGEEQEDGGGSDFQLNTRVAAVPSTFPTSDASLEQRLGVRPKAAR